MFGTYNRVCSTARQSEHCRLGVEREYACGTQRFAETIVDDYGRLINPMLTMGQIQGGVAQGIGQALLEHTVYDLASGQLLSGSLTDYAVPRADDLPPFDITLEELPTAANPLGVKGSGQAGCIAAPQTILGAIVDALAPLGVDHLDMPATPERVWGAIRAARGFRPLPPSGAR